MRTQLTELMPNAFKWFLKELTDAPFCTVEPTGKRNGMRYLQPGKEFRLSTEGGVYAVYLKDSEKPFHIGQGGDLRQRVEYHFSESSAAKKDSPVKKALRLMGKNDPTHLLVRFRYVEVPFGRLEIEHQAHALYGINTKATGAFGRVKKNMVLA